MYLADMVSTSETPASGYGSVLCKVAVGSARALSAKEPGCSISLTPNGMIGRGREAGCAPTGRKGLSPPLLSPRALSSGVGTI